MCRSMAVYLFEMGIRIPFVLGALYSHQINAIRFLFDVKFMKIKSQKAFPVYHRQLASDQLFFEKIPILIYYFFYFLSRS